MLEAVRSAVRAVLAPIAQSAGAVAMAENNHALGAVALAQDVRENLPLALLLSTLAGGSTGLGGFCMVANPNKLSLQRLGLWQGAAAGFMASVSLFDMLPSVLETLHPAVTAFYVILGALLFLSLRLFVPEPDMSAYVLDTGNDPSNKQSNNDPAERKRISRAVLFSGMVTAIGISLHNFPEGIAVCVASLRGTRFGLPLAAAIAIHNLPEGAAVALPIYFATGDRWYALRISFLSGMAEPLGVVFMALFVYSTGIVLTRGILSVMLAAVAGVMLIICVAELIPQSLRHAGAKPACVSFLAGLVTMSVALVLIEWSGVGGH